LIAAKNEDIAIKNQLKSVYLKFGIGYKLGNVLNLGTRYNLRLSNSNDVSGFLNKNQNRAVQSFMGYVFL
tara:strand:+ start:732 stop:941 length:210 start_codon:yes stop_codon:yes gene_type:complete